MTEIDWSTAPDWANYHTVDVKLGSQKNVGLGLFHEKQPATATCTEWWVSYGKTKYDGKEYDLTGMDWKETLTSRLT